MPNSKLLKRIVGPVLLFFATISLSAQPTGSIGVARKLHLWYIVDSSAGFSRIFPHKDLISSLSVFGNPSQSFIDSCRLYKIGLYAAVSDNETAINSTAKADAVIDKYVRLCVRGGYDGIDLDYEGLTAGVQSGYARFLKKLSAALHRNRKKLSHCVGFYPTMTDQGPDTYFYTPETISETCDLVRVMCYDMYFAPGKNVPTLMTRQDCQGIGPTSNYPWTLEAMRFWSKYVGPDKLVMCLPAYSNDYAFGTRVTGDQVYASYPVQNPAKVSDSTWLWYEKLNVYNYADSLNRKHLFYASDAKSTSALLTITGKLALQQIGFWHLASIDEPTWQAIAGWLKQ